MPQEYPIILRGFPGTVRRVQDAGLDLFIPVEAAQPVPLILFLRDEPAGPGPDLSRFFAQRGLAMAAVEVESPSVDEVLRSIQRLQTVAGDHGLDPARLGLWGLGAGAHLAIGAALTSPDGVKAVVAAYPEGNTADYLQGGGAPPILLAHGLADVVRPPSATELLFDALGLTGGEVTLCLVEKHGDRFMERNDFDLGDFPRVRKYECRGGEPPVISEAPPLTFGTVETFFRRWL
jgi:dienelactone hydrolase